MKKSLLALAIVATLSSASASAAFEPFTISPDGMGASTAYADFTAYGIAGTYAESVTLFGDGTYTSTLLGKLNSFTDASDQSIDDTGLREANAYGLWATVTFSGNYTATSVGFGNFDLDFSFNPGGTFALTYDPGRKDTSSGIFLTDVNTDDIQIASGTLTGVGTGTCNTSLNPSCGSFLNVATTLTLENGGENFFVWPNPFYIRTTNSGVFDQLVYNPSVLGVAQIMNGSMHIHMAKVPEPSTLALLGLGLSGLGLSLRRRKAA